MKSYLVFFQVTHLNGSTAFGDHVCPVHDEFDRSCPVTPKQVESVREFLENKMPDCKVTFTAPWMPLERDS